MELEEEEVEVEAAVEEELGLEDLAGAEAQILLRVGMMDKTIFKNATFLLHKRDARIDSFLDTSYASSRRE